MFGFLLWFHSGRELLKLRTVWGSPVWFFIYLANFTSIRRGSFPPFGPLGPPWSLQIEEQFYLVFPALVKTFRNKLREFLIGMIVLSLLWRLYWLVYEPTNAMIQYVGTLSRVDALAAGGLAALLIRNCEHGRLRRFVAFAMPMLTTFLVVFYLYAGNEPSNPLTRSLGYSLNVLAFASLILWAVQRQNEPASAIFRWTLAKLHGWEVFPMGFTCFNCRCSHC